MTDSILRTEYNEAKHQCRADSKGFAAGCAILRLAMTSLKFLVEECLAIDLVSRVQGKQYFSFKKANVVARPANSEFFLADTDAGSLGYLPTIQHGYA